MLLKLKFFTVAVCSLAASSWAQNGVNWGGLELTPAVGVEVGYQDNIARARLDDNKISSLVTVLTPSVGVVAGSGANEYTLSYELVHGIYNGSAVDDYTDHVLDLGAGLSLNSRNRLSFSGGYLLGHDERGAAFSQGFGDALIELDTRVVTTFGAAYNFGAETIGTGFEVRIESNKVNYDERLVNDGLGGVFDNTLVRDRTNKTAGATYSLGISHSMALLVTADTTSIDYDVEGSRGDLDSNETTFLAGVTWEGTAKTTGTISAGYGKRKFANPARENFSGPRWNASIEYMMRSYSVFTLTTEQAGREGRGTADFINTTTYSIDWRHAWGPRVSTSLSYELSTEDYEGTARIDDTQSSGLSIGYALGRTIKLSVGYSRVLVNSNDNTFDYDSNIAFLGVTAAL